MLSLVVVAIMLGFPTAFTLMGMGMIFTWLAYDRDITQTLDLMVQAAFKVMAQRRADRRSRCSSSWATWSSAPT